MQDIVVDKIVAHLAPVAAGEVPEAAHAAAKMFIADTLGVGIAGDAAEATVWGSGERLPLAQAAMVNAYQIHSQEFDCVHEGAVVHPMAAILSSVLGWAERASGIPGEIVLRAVI